MEKMLRKVWDRVIETYFNQGLIAYERQLQAHLFHELKNELKDHLIWVEPYMYVELKHELDGTMPDMILTNQQNHIVAVIELKCQPWSNVIWEKDIKKLKAFERLSTQDRSIPLNWYPISSNWNKQKLQDQETRYTFSKDCLFVFGVIGKKDCTAVGNLEVGIPNFVHLSHWIEKGKN